MGWAVAQQKEFAEMAGSEVCRAEQSAYLHFSGMRLSFGGDIAVNLKLLNTFAAPSQPRVAAVVLKLEFYIRRLNICKHIMFCLL